MGLIKVAEDYLEALNDLQTAGIELTEYNGRGRGSIDDTMSDFNYGLLTADSGKRYGYTKIYSQIVQEQNSTGKVDSILLGQGYDWLLSLTNEKIEIGNGCLLDDINTSAANGKVAGVLLSEKISVVQAILAALGYICDYAKATEIATANYFNNSNFNWADYCVNDKVITYVEYDGKCFIPYHLADAIRGKLIEEGLLETGDAEGYDLDTEDEFINVNHCTMLELSKYVDRLNIYLDPTVFESNYEHALENGFEDLGGVGYIQGFNGGWYITVFEDKPVNGTIVWEPINVGSEKYHSKFGLRFNEPTNYITAAVHWSQGSYSSTTITRGTVQANTVVDSQGFVGDNFANTFNYYSGLGLDEQTGADLPTEEGSIRTDYSATWYIKTMFVNGSRDEKEPVITLRIPTPDEGQIGQDDAQDGELTDDELEDITPSEDELADETGTPTEEPEDDTGEAQSISITDVSDIGLIHIYNPSILTLKNFSQWLWSNNIFDNFSKLFQDPMGAILNLSLMYVSPSNYSADSDILVGNLDSNVTSRTVNCSYVTIDCGTQYIDRWYNNALDYIKTKIELYLPYVGFIELSPAEVIGKTIGVKVTVDLISGACLYNVYVNSNILYSYSGNCALQLPLTGSNFTGVFSTIASIAGGAIKGAALGPSGAVLGAVGSAVGGAVGGGFSGQVERSGNLGSNAGTFGERKPKLIITRFKKYDPPMYQKFYGYPSNTSTTLSTLANSGYTLVKDIRLKGISATKGELEEIEQLLKEGVIL